MGSSPFRKLPSETTCAQPDPADLASPIASTDDIAPKAAFKRRNVIVASVFPHHFDVYLAVVWTLERVLSHVPGSRVRVFAEPFGYGFQSVAERLGLYSGKRSNPEEMIPFLSSEEGLSVDVVILGTCEFEYVVS